MYAATSSKLKSNPLLAYAVVFLVFGLIAGMVQRQQQSARVAQTVQPVEEMGKTILQHGLAVIPEKTESLPIADAATGSVSSIPASAPSLQICQYTYTDEWHTMVFAHPCGLLGEDYSTNKELY